MASLPKYSRLKEILRERITGMSAGEQLASEAELCRLYHVSRTTVRKALDELGQDGLIHSIQGKGTFVTARKFSSGYVQYTRGFAADMAEHGVQVARQMLARTVEPANEDVARELQVPLGTAVVKFVRLRSAGDCPYDLCTNYLPLHLFPDIEFMEWPENSLYSLLRLHYGVQLGRGVRSLEADVCTAEEARLLKITSKSPVLVLRSTMFDIHDYPVEFGISRMRSDRARIVIDVVQK
jgi:GntR family transcriptional regulator